MALRRAPLRSAEPRRNIEITRRKRKQNIQGGEQKLTKRFLKTILDKRKTEIVLRGTNFETFRPADWQKFWSFSSPNWLAF
jgi:hypothetical protein